MKKLLIIGRPFGYLEKELESKEIEYEILSISQIQENINKIANANNVLCVGLNMSLNGTDICGFMDLLTKTKNSVNIFLWTHEPFWDSIRQNEVILFGKKIHIFNPYVGNVYLSPYSHYFGIGGYLWSEKRMDKVVLPSKDFLKNRFNAIETNGIKTCAYASCFHDKRLEFDKSLVKERNDLIKNMYDINVCDVYGKNWYGNWALNVKEESRAGKTIGDKKLSWGEIKVKNSQEKYSYSICLENALLPNYVTEKFGQAIESWCIPIYCVGNGLEDIMSLDGGIIFRPGEMHAENLSEIINSINFDEYFDRLRKITESYNCAISNFNFVNEERRRPARFLISEMGIYS